MINSILSKNGVIVERISYQGRKIRRILYERVGGELNA